MCAREFSRGRRAFPEHSDIESARRRWPVTKRDRGSIGGFFKIWRASKDPFLTKTGQVFKNQFIKMRTLKDCCGNYGEPGC